MELVILLNITGGNKMKIKKLLLLLTISLSLTFCGSPVDNNSDGSYEERLVGVWDRISFQSTFTDTFGVSRTTSSSDEYQMSFLEVKRSKYFAESNGEESHWWAASKDSLYFWSKVRVDGEPQELKREDAISYGYKFSGDTLIWSFPESIATDDNGKPHGTSSSKSFYWK